MATLLKRRHRQQIEKQINFVLDGVDTFIGRVYKRLSHAPRFFHKLIAATPRKRRKHR